MRETTELTGRGARRAARQARRAERRALRGGAITGGVFLIGLGMLTLTGWWWPGIMLVIGLAAAAELMRQGQAAAALGTFAGLAAIPLAVAVVQAIHIPWLPVGAFVLLGLGLVALARAAAQREGGAR